MASVSSVPERRDTQVEAERVPYGLYTRISDRLHGWWDGKRRRPSGATPPPHWSMLDGVATTRYKNELAAMRKEMADVLKECAAASQRLRAAQQREPEVAALLRECERRAEEERDEQDKARRLGAPMSNEEKIEQWNRMHKLELDLTAARAEYDRVRKELNEAQQLASRLIVGLTARVDLGNARNEISHAHAKRRQMRYRLSLENSHPKPTRVADLLGGLEPPRPPTFHIELQADGQMHVEIRPE